MNENRSGFGVSVLPSAATLKRRRRWRMTKDFLARYGVAIGGVGVIVAITLIFFYLTYVVLPLFKPADAEFVASYAVPAADAGETLQLAMEEQAEIAVRYTDGGEVVFFRAHGGAVVDRMALPIPEGVRVTSFAAANPATAVVAFGLSNGQAIVVRPRYKVSYPNDRRQVTPEIGYPLGEEPLAVDPQGQPLHRLAVRTSADEATLVAATEDRRLVLTHVAKETNFLTDEVTLQRSNHALPFPEHGVSYILLDNRQRSLYLAGSRGNVTYLDIVRKNAPEVVQRLQVLPEGRQLTALQFLAGDFALMVGDSSGRISEWFPVRDPQNNTVLRQIRSFDSQEAPIVALAPEFARKGFLAADASGQLGVYHATAHRTMLLRDLGEGPVQALAIGPRANGTLAQMSDGYIKFWRLHNEHPEVSWSSLWGKVWYEGYDEPAHIWQSSSASEDFEPKFSLTPLSFGTLKAAFYAMIFAVPLAILGAVFTAHFMSPKMRTVVKPTIEIMEALPTVILGFLAGLWLAPFIEVNMPGIFSIFLIMPIGILLFAYLWSRAPGAVRAAIPDGWEAALLIPIVVLMVWGSLALSPMLEQAFFGGNMRGWLTNEMGIDFDQRNSIVVGLAMGFAVIPTIFSIAEDAIFGVPKHLSNGSLALGATPWQTMWRVVLLTASPGIFSAVMIGLGRAVGETMIVLMATGNTPIMDMNLFEGMRTLSANIAVEMPESEVNGTHYRVLFLAGLVLFLFTFFFNTVAEIVRQRLRRKYSSL